MFVFTVHFCGYVAIVIGGVKYVGFPSYVRCVCVFCQVKEVLSAGKCFASMDCVGRGINPTAFLRGVCGQRIGSVVGVAGSEIAISVRLPGAYNDRVRELPRGPR